jgi:membrane protease YdiL (CAAX protease family)
VTDYIWVWRAPPGWPVPPEGWWPPPHWQPPPDWPAPPADWQWWVPVAAPYGVLGGQSPTTVTVTVDEPSRRSLVWETRFVLFCFLIPVVTTAVVILVRHFQDISDANQLTTVVPGHLLSNFFLGIVSYTSVAAVVPLALLLLARTGQKPGSIGLGWPRWNLDIWPGLGLAGMSFGAEYVVLIPFVILLGTHSTAVNTTMIGHVPAYYVIYALTTSATTAIAEEVIVNGYLITRLEQFGWTPQRALALSLTLRTSYHIYYGVGFLLTIPFGYFVTRSFQKHHRLNRPIAAHFIYDSILLTIAVLTS